MSAPDLITFRPWNRGRILVADQSDEICIRHCRGFFGICGRIPVYPPCTSVWQFGRFWRIGRDLKSVSYMVSMDRRSATPPASTILTVLVFSRFRNCEFSAYPPCTLRAKLRVGIATKGSDSSVKMLSVHCVSSYYTSALTSVASSSLRHGAQQWMLLRCQSPCAKCPESSAGFLSTCPARRNLNVCHAYAAEP